MRPSGRTEIARSLVQIGAMLRAATPDSLVLLDELGRATDPEEGGALGVATYGLALYALSLGAMVEIAALRETSVIFAAIIGGFNNSRGALLGGLIVGVCETLAGAYVSSAYKEAVALIIFMVVILFKPQGLLGLKVERKV